MDRLFKLLNIVVDVVFIFDNCVVWLFINPNKDVDVVFKLLIDNIEFVDNELNY